MAQQEVLAVMMMTLETMTSCSLHLSACHQAWMSRYSKTTLKTMMNFSLSSISTKLHHVVEVCNLW